MCASRRNFFENRYPAITLSFRVEPGMRRWWYIILFFYPFVFDISPYKGKVFTGRCPMLLISCFQPGFEKIILLCDSSSLRRQVQDMNNLPPCGTGRGFSSGLIMCESPKVRPQKLQKATALHAPQIRIYIHGVNYKQAV